jgi:hypothetical protein
MPRNISFALTTDQIRNRTKTVTRRLGWKNLKPGEILQACVKCMGLKPGEKIERLGLIRVVSVRQEALNVIAADLGYGFDETTKEGFPFGHGKHWPSEFVDMFCRSMGCDPDAEVTRIEFEYMESEVKDGH